jgi:hypothetical protein
MNVAIVTMLLTFFVTSLAKAQSAGFTSDPYEVEFITSDLRNFWAAFDSLDTAEGNPFTNYIRRGSPGLQGFIPHRIISDDSLLQMVQRRKNDYERNRNIEARIKEKEEQIKPYFYGFKYWYPYTKFPPVYFVVGRFNSGGTISESGLIIGAEKLDDLDGLPQLVIHESVHFQQKWPERETTLLEHSILEGSADFIATLITGISPGIEAYAYGEKHKDRLCREFVERMHQPNIEDWLYSTSGKDDRPNDLGYWMGYRIAEAYFNQMENKKLAVNHILNVEDYETLLQKSGFLEEYLHEPSVQGGN